MACRAAADREPYDAFRRSVLEYEGSFGQAFELSKRERDGDGPAIHPIKSAPA
jgi:hypothetical protein